MSRKYMTKTWRKPAHWSEERYEKRLKERGLKRPEKSNPPKSDRKPSFIPPERDKMIINRVWAMPNKKTFTIKPIKDLLRQQFRQGIEILDPFPFEYKEDATEMLNNITDETYEYAVFDPPYSPRQLKECYKGKGEYDTKSSTWSNWKNLMAKKIKVGGKVISFGWNSGGLGMRRGFKIIEILLVPHGGQHNDTICVVEEKISLIK